MLIAREVATPVPKPVRPVEMGSPVALLIVALEGVPRAPFKSTTAPLEPVFTVKALATPVPKPDTPVEIGSPVAFVSVTEDGVPSTGVINVGEVLNTLLPLPVELVTPVPPFDTARVPESVTAPVLVVDGVSPVLPALKDVTPPVDVCQAGTPETKVKT